MSRRSYDSVAHEKRVSKYRVSDDDLFECVQRSHRYAPLLILSQLCSPRCVSRTLTFNFVPANASTQHPELHHLPKGRTSTLERIRNKGERPPSQDLWRYLTLYRFHRGYLQGDQGWIQERQVPREASQSTRTETTEHCDGKGTRVRGPSILSIAVLPDVLPRYSDQLTRRTMGSFYNQFMGDPFRRQMKENRSIEELILMFASQATGVLRKEPTLLVDDAWKVEVNNQIAQFVRMLRDCLKSISHVSPELNARLDAYHTKLSQSSSESSHDTASTSRDRGDSVSTTPGISTNIHDMPFVLVIAKLFKIPEHAMQTEVDRLRKTCTEKVRAEVLMFATELKISAGGRS